MRFFVTLIVVTTLFSCRVDRAFLPGQEGMETVHQAQQVKAGLDMTAGNGLLMHGSINYSPLKNIGVLYDTRLAPNSQSHTVAAGYYKAKYKVETLQDSNEKDVNVITGIHWDVYGGASYLNTHNSIVNLGFNTDFFTGNTRQSFYELSWQGMRYFAQGGVHIKSAHVGIDAIIRQSWLEARQVGVYGLNPAEGMTPEKDLADKNPRPYTEIGFKMNFGNFSTPFYCGFVTRLGADTAWTKTAYAHSIVFLGVNLEIAKLFKK